MRSKTCNTPAIPVTPVVRAFRARGVELQVDAQRLEELLAPFDI